MTITSARDSSLNSITGAYQSSDIEKQAKEDAIGKDAFLTMLIAELENQDPLNPMEGTEFSAQLAQFSQLEQLINLNDSMEGLAQAYTDNSEKDVVGYIGKQVTGDVDSINVTMGTVSGGFYSLDKPADIMVTITDSSGQTIKTMYEGQQPAGSQLISWDGTDKNGVAVEDGAYSYTVMGNSGYGFSKVPSTVTGKVDGITYNNDKPYLVVQGVLLDPTSLTAVQEMANDSSSDSSQSALDYLGRTISSNSPLVLVEDGAVAGEDLSFHLDTPNNVTLKIFNASGEAVKTIPLTSEETSGGDNNIQWNGTSDSGYQVPDGLYYYTASTNTGYAKTPISNEVSEIKYVNGSQYLVMNDSGRLVALSAITGIN